MEPVYAVVRNILLPPLRLLFRWKIDGLEKVPRTGPAIIAPNHISNFDPLCVAYLVDHVSIHLAFGVCSAVSVFLVVSYLRLVVGTRFAAREAALAQFIYLVAFSYAFFLKGFTGLAITVGSIITLFVVMQATGKVRWRERFSAPAPAEQLGPPTPVPSVTGA